MVDDIIELPTAERYVFTFEQFIDWKKKQVMNYKFALQLKRDNGVIILARGVNLNSCNQAL